MASSKNSRFTHFLGTLVILVGLGGAGFLLFQRSQPKEDPWAESYWQDATPAS